MAMQPEEMVDLRGRLGLTQEGLAAELDVTRQTIGEMEKGRSPIDRRTEYAMRYILAKREGIAAGILGQGELATMNLADLIIALEARYELKAKAKAEPTNAKKIEMLRSGRVKFV